MRDQVFISYSHADTQWLLMLKDRLEPYLDAGSFTYWDDSKIEAGMTWFNEIKQALAAAKVAVFLVTPKFLKSEFIKNHEMKPLIEAAQTEGVTIIWIAVDYSGYEKTWLKDLQAGNDPKRPLTGMEPWESGKVLVEVCEKIEQAFGPRPDPAVSLPGPGKIVTEYEVVRCNRSRYLNRFASFFMSGLKSRPNLPQIYMIYGKINECHDTLVRRIYREVIKPHADKELAQSQGKGILHKQSDISWPEPLGELESQKEDLQIELSKEYAGEIPLDYPPAFPAVAFAELPQLSNYRYVIVQHSIHLEQWTEADWSATVRDLLDWYLNSYWGALAGINLRARSDGTRSQFLVFIKITYRGPTAWENISPFRASKFDKELVKNDLRDLAIRANGLFPCHLLDELMPPPYTEVYKWYTDNNIFSTVQDRLDAAIKMYQTHGEKITMAVIEKELSQYHLS